MSTLAQFMQSEQPVNPTHLLLVGPSKIGKTDYVADLILDGYTVIYVDADNGLMTLHKRVKNNPEAMSRVHYLRTTKPYEVCIDLFGGKAMFRWNTTQDKLFSQNDSLTDSVFVIDKNRIPVGVVIVVDSWTSVSLNLLHDSASRNGVSFETFNEGGQAAYGDAGRRANLLCTYIQGCKHHVVIQAHVEHYERLERPKGSARDLKAKDMIIKENIAVPSSVSKPHGFAMSKFFNEVGWMTLDAMGNIVLDFRQMADRVGGGSALDKKSPKAEYRFATLFGAPPKIIEGDWIRTNTVAEVKESMPQPAKPATSVDSNKPGGATNALPAKGSMLGLKQ